jgi:hypothetical protein
VQQIFQGHFSIKEMFPAAQFRALGTHDGAQMNRVIHLAQKTTPQIIMQMHGTISLELETAQQMVHQV